MFSAATCSSVLLRLLNRRSAAQVITGHNSPTDCARESVKTSSDAEDSNAFLRYVPRTCNIIVTSFQGKTRFPRSQKIRGFYSKSRGAETKHVGKIFSV